MLPAFLLSEIASRKHPITPLSTDIVALTQVNSGMPLKFKSNLKQVSKQRSRSHHSIESHQSLCDKTQFQKKWNIYQSQCTYSSHISCKQYINVVSFCCKPQLSAFIPRKVSAIIWNNARASITSHLKILAPLFLYPRGRALKHEKGVKIIPRFKR